jgi:hypothetical protein
MKFAAAIALVSAAAVSAEVVYLCPFESTNSISVLGAEQHVHVADTAVATFAAGCEDVTAPKGMEQYLVEAKNQDMVESALNLDPEVYTVRQLSSDMFLIQSPLSDPEAAYTLHTTLFECDFDAVNTVTVPEQVKKSTLRSAAPSEEQRLNKAAFVNAVGASGSEFMSTLRDLTGEGNLNINGAFRGWLQLRLFSRGTPIFLTLVTKAYSALPIFFFRFQGAVPILPTTPSLPTTSGITLTTWASNLASSLSVFPPPTPRCCIFGSVFSAFCL